MKWPAVGPDALQVIEVSRCRWGVLSTIGSGKAAGYPSGSVVEYATSEQGHLLFAFSSMSSHTTDVKHVGRASLTIPAPGFKVSAIICQDFASHMAKMSDIWRCSIDVLSMHMNTTSF